MKHTELIYKKTKGVSPFAYEVVGEWLYFCNLDFPGLFRYHFKSNVCEFVSRFQNKFINRNFFKMRVYKDEIWMLPFLDGNIVCFNIQTQETSYYAIPKNIDEKIIPFIDIFFEKEKAFILPHGNNRFIIKMDLRTHKMEEIELLITKETCGNVSFLGAIQNQNKFYLAEENRNILILFDSSNNEVEIINADQYLLKERTVSKIGNKICFFPWDIMQKLVIYDISKREFSLIEYPIENLSEDEVCVFVVFEEEIWILANKEKKLYQLDKNFKIESVISLLNFNENEEKVYVSGTTVADRIFIHGYDGTPLIQIRNRNAQILDVSQKNILESYIEMIRKEDVGYHNWLHKSGVGKSIYGNVLESKKTQKAGGASNFQRSKLRSI